VEKSGSAEQDAFLRLGRIVRNGYYAVTAFLDALFDSAAWARFGRRLIKRAVLVVVVLMAFAGITWNYSSEIFLWLLIPAEGRLSPFEDGRPVFTEPAEMFAVTVNLAFKGGALAAFPVAVVSLYTLFSQWLPSRARTFLRIFVPTVFMAFAGGVAFVYYVILPTSLGFLLSFHGDVAEPLITVTGYFELVLSLMFWMGVVFELPLVMYLLARLDLVSYTRMKWSRLAIWIFAPFFAAVITPSFDVYTWLLVMVPLILLYEAGLFLAWVARPEQGNYLWVKSIWGVIVWVVRRPVVAYNKVIWFAWRKWR